jgi:hypothetical protein
VILHHLAVSGSCQALPFHTGPELGVTYSKKNQKNMIPSCGIILNYLDVGKKSKLDKSNLPESLFTEISYHIQGCMAFR